MKISVLFTHICRIGVILTVKCMFIVVNFVSRRRILVLFANFNCAGPIGLY